MKKGHLHSYLCCHHIDEKLLQHFTCGLVFQHFPHYLLRWLHATGSSHGKPVQNFATPPGASKKKILQRLSLATFAPLQNWALLIGFLDFVLKYHWLQCRLASVSKSQSKGRASCISAVHFTQRVRFPSIA